MGDDLLLDRTNYIVVICPAIAERDARPVDEIFIVRVRPQGGRAVIIVALCITVVCIFRFDV